MTKLEQAARQLLDCFESGLIDLNAVTALREALDNSLKRKCFADYQPNHAIDRACASCPVAAECQTGEQAEQEPVATHICNLWVDPITKEYVVDHCDHPIEELIPAYSISQYLSKKPDYWLGYGLQAYTQKPFEGATPLYAAPVRTKDLTDDEIERALDAAKVPELPDGYKSVDLEIARAVIAAYKEKNK